MKSFLNKVEKSFLYCDMYGRRVDVYINSQTMVKSRIGACFSLLIVLFSLYSFVSNIISWSRNEFTQIVPAFHTFNSDKMLKQNTSYPYDFDSSNYYVYFALFAVKDEKFINYDELSRFFPQSIVYDNDIGNLSNLETEHCFVKKNNDFMLINSEDEIDKNSKSSFRMCIKDGIKYPMGLFSNKSIPAITNSTFNNNSYAPTSEINDLLQYINVQVSIPKSIYDFTDFASPRKRAYDYRYYKLDELFSKSFSASLIPSFLMTDFGWFFDDYTEDTIDFNLDNLQYETMKIREDKTMFKFDFAIGHNKQIYFRKNPNFFSIMANFGGIINVLFLLGKIFCSTYNFLLLKYSLINISFSNLDVNSKGSPK